MKLFLEYLWLLLCLICCENIVQAQSDKKNVYEGTFRQHLTNTEEASINRAHFSLETNEVNIIFYLAEEDYYITKYSYPVEDTILVIYNDIKIDKEDYKAFESFFAEYREIQLSYRCGTHSINIFKPLRFQRIDKISSSYWAGEGVSLDEKKRINKMLANNYWSLDLKLWNNTKGKPISYTRYKMPYLRMRCIGMFTNFKERRIVDNILRLAEKY